VDVSPTLVVDGVHEAARAVDDSVEVDGRRVTPANTGSSASSAGRDGHLVAGSAVC
jgi:hypothetical protein